METPILTAVADPGPTIRMPVPPKGETYLVGRRGSPHVHEYRDFLERNRVSFRWIDIDRNPLVRFLGASPSLRRRALPFFLFADGSHLDVSQDRTRSSPSRARAPSSRRGSACTRAPAKSATTSSSSAPALPG